MSGISYLIDDKKSDASTMEEGFDDEAFVLELSSDSELPEDEKKIVCFLRIFSGGTGVAMVH